MLEVSGAVPPADEPAEYHDDFPATAACIVAGVLSLHLLYPLMTDVGRALANEGCEALLPECQCLL